MQGPEFEGLTYDDCLPIIAEKLKNRMRWVWGADIDEQYEEKARLLRSTN
jgi:salicylate hydroxylase